MSSMSQNSGGVTNYEGEFVSKSKESPPYANDGGVHMGGLNHTMETH
jgi:hypothetical protein